MIAEFVEQFKAHEAELRAEFARQLPEDYNDIVKDVVGTIACLDINRIRTIDEGEYSGTLLYIIGTKCLGSGEYVWTMVDYGSCSGCDTLIEIRDRRDGEECFKFQVDDIITLALHIVEGMHWMRKRGGDA